MRSYRPITPSRLPSAASIRPTQGPLITPISQRQLRRHVIEAYPGESGRACYRNASPIRE